MYFKHTHVENIQYKPGIEIKWYYNGKAQTRIENGFIVAYEDRSIPSAILHPRIAYAPSVIFECVIILITQELASQSNALKLQHFNCTQTDNDLSDSGVRER